MAQISRGRQARRNAARHFGAARRTVATTPQPAVLRHLSRPWFALSAILGALGAGLIVGGMFAFRAGHIGLTDALTPVGAMLLATSSAPLVLGIVRILAQDAPPREDHCGRCQFYHAGATYERGACLADRLRQPTARLERCDRFIFSERAMVRDRLAEAPHVLGPTPHP